MQYNVVATAFAAAVLGVMTAGGTASAQRADFGFEGIHRAARSVEKNARDVHEELDQHFRRSPAYRHMHRHAQEIERLAKAIHDITDGRGGRRLLRQTVNRLDDEVHHFVEVVDDSRQFRNIPERGYAHLRQEVKELHRAVIAMKRQLD